MILGSLEELVGMPSGPRRGDDGPGAVDLLEKRAREEVVAEDRPERGLYPR